jgi:uroporphyrin-3 C-methyltransferase
MSARDTRQPLVSATTLPPPRRRLPVLRLLLLLLVLGGAGLVLKNDLDQGERDRAESRRLDLLESTVQGLGADQHSLADDNAAHRHALAQLQHQVDGLNTTLSADQRKQWQLAEVDYYVRLAEQHLILTRDVQGARALLDVADRILAATNDNDLLKLRAAIASDRLALSAASKVDVAGTYLRLSALDQRLALLPVPMEAGGHRQQGAIQAPASAEPTAASGWRDHMQDLMNQGVAKFRGLITVRHYAEPIKPLMSDAERALVTENLRLHLGQAQLALLHGEDSVYQASLKTAQDDFARYFQLLPAPEYTAIQQELAALAQVQVSPAVPDLRASVGALNALSDKLPLHGTAADGTRP